MMNLSGCQVFGHECLPKNWDIEPLGLRLELAYGRGLKEEDRRSGKIPVYGSNGVVGHHDTPLIRGPGILVGRKGTVGAVQYSEADFWPIDTVYFVVPLKEDDLEFLYYLLQFLPLPLLNAATGVPGLSRRDAYALLGAFPPLQVQAEIVSVMKKVDSICDGIVSSTWRMRVVRDGVHVMSGASRPDAEAQNDLLSTLLLLRRKLLWALLHGSATPDELLQRLESAL